MDIIQWRRVILEWWETSEMSLMIDQIWIQRSFLAIVFGERKIPGGVWCSSWDGSTKLRLGQGHRQSIEAWNLLLTAQSTKEKRAAQNASPGILEALSWVFSWVMPMHASLKTISEKAPENIRGNNNCSLYRCRNSAYYQESEWKTSSFVGTG